jgi:hypothetical protein
MLDGTLRQIPYHRSRHDQQGPHSRATAETAAWLSLVAYVRRALTDYDDLLTQGYDHDSARFFVAAQIDGVLSSWGVRRKISAID